MFPKWDSESNLWDETPRSNYGYKRQLRTYFRVKNLKRDPETRKRLNELSFEANVRCCECSFSYNLNRSSTCPICHSDRSRLLSTEDPAFEPKTIFISFVIVVLFTWFTLWYLPSHFL